MVAASMNSKASDVCGDTTSDISELIRQVASLKVSNVERRDYIAEQLRQLLNEEQCSLQKAQQSVSSRVESVVPSNNFKTVRGSSKIVTDSCHAHSSKSLSTTNAGDLVSDVTDSDSDCDSDSDDDEQEYRDKHILTIGRLGRQRQYLLQQDLLNSTNAANNKSNLLLSVADVQLMVVVFIVVALIAVMGLYFVQRINMIA